MKKETAISHHSNHIAPDQEPEPLDGSAIPEGGVDLNDLFGAENYDTWAPRFDEAVDAADVRDDSPW
jgi:hypothetical protein